MRLEVAGKTHVGMKRTRNEDAMLLCQRLQLFCVADGMGGHSAGEVASAMALSEISEFFDRTEKDEDATWPYKEDRSLKYDENWLVTAVKLANLRIYEASTADPKRHGMGTTVVAASFAPTQTVVTHVGDSRVYQFVQAEKKLVQLTEDHSLLSEYIRAKTLTPEEVANFPHKNVITRALGMKETVQVDVSRLQLAPGDILLLCCDGLSGMVPDPSMAEILATQPDLDRATRQLLVAANAAGGVDNITVILVRWNP
jgi:protein phosphatase